METFIPVQNVYFFVHNLFLDFAFSARKLKLRSFFKKIYFSNDKKNLIEQY